MSEYRKTLGGSDRGVSPVIGTLLLVAAVLVVAASVAVVGFDLSSDIREPAPTVAESKGELKTQDSYDGGVVRITHVAGDSVTVDDIEVIVGVTTDQESANARLVNLPSDYGSADGQPFTDQNLAGDDIISKGHWSEDWSAGVLHTDYENTLSAGSFFEFRIKSTGIELQPGDTVTVRVIHVPSDSIIIKQKLTSE